MKHTLFIIFTNNDSISQCAKENNFSVRDTFQSKDKSICVHSLQSLSYARRFSF